MGFDELIESLRKEAEEKTRELWREAEVEAGRMRASVPFRLEAMEQESAAGSSSEEESRKILLEAETRARTIRLVSEERLSARLYSLAASSLGLLKGKGYEEMFGRLVLELPACRWQAVRVNPEDSGLAKKSFPGAEIETDGNISGGMEAGAERGRIRVINTFEKRLERSWPQMLPALMGDIGREVMDDGTPPES